MAAGTVPTSEAEAAEAAVEPSRRVRRHQATKARIVEAAWEVARAEGLSGIALRDLAARVDLSQSSLYSYFDSKHALYDAMFADGYRRLLDEVGRLELDDDPRQALKQVASFIVRVFADDIPRSQLLFTRTIPGFDPSPESYALAEEFFAEGRLRVAAAGLTTRARHGPVHRARRRARRPAARQRSRRRPLAAPRRRGDRHVARSHPDQGGEMTMTATGTDVTTIPRIGHDEAMRITAVEFDRMTALFRRLDGDDWTRPTDNDQWDVRATALHLLGAAEANASLPESVRQFTRGKRLFKQIGGNHWVDGINEIQIRDRAGVANDQIADRYAAAAPGAVKVRRRIPAPIRGLRVIDMGPPIGKETVGYLMDMVYTRDVWMHRVDIARATGQTMELTAEHDGRMIADMVAEWASYFDGPFVLELDGVAGGSFHRGDGGAPDCEHVRVDAVEFVRIISGRAQGTGLLAHALPL